MPTSKTIINSSFRLEELQLALKEQTKPVQNIESRDHDFENQDHYEDTDHQILHKNRIAKLIEERDTLLQTGVYTVDDRVITEIETEIQQLIAQTA